MKNEKDFLDSMWFKIDAEQEALMQEYLVSQREKQLRKRNIRLILLPLLCAICLTTIWYFLKLDESFILLICVITAIFAFVTETRIYKEGEKNGN